MFIYRRAARALTRIHFHLDDCGARRNVVFLHSLGADSLEWQSEWHALKGRANLLAIDARGHGLSGTAEDVTLDDWVADIREVVQFCGFRTAAFVGLSMGGVQALGLAVQIPEIVERLLLADTFAEVDKSLRDKKIKSLADAIRHEGMLEFGRNYAKSRLIREVGSYTYGDPLIRSIAAMAPQDYLASATACFSVALGLSLQSVKVPALVVRGSMDDAAPLALSKQLVEGLANANYMEIPNAGHLSNLDEPTRFNEIMTGFLES